MRPRTRAGLQGGGGQPADGVYITDAKRVIQYVNPAYTKHTGIQPDEIVGRSVTDIVAEGMLFKGGVRRRHPAQANNVTDQPHPDAGGSRSTPMSPASLSSTGTAR